MSTQQAVRAIETIPSILVTIERKEAELADILAALRDDIKGLREKPRIELNARSYAESIDALRDEIERLRGEAMARARSPDQMMFVFE